jgi:hypothetical protein
LTDKEFCEIFVSRNYVTKLYNYLIQFFYTLKDEILIECEKNESILIAGWPKFQSNANLKLLFADVKSL